MMKKTLAFGIVLLFIGVAFAPSLYADVETISEQQEVIEIPIQMCGLGGINEYTAKLTKEDADRLDTMFVDIHSRLNASESREETISIYMDAVVELDNLGLLDGYSVEEVQKIVTGELYQNSLMTKFLSLISRNKQGSLEKYRNKDCYITGEVTNSTLWAITTVIGYYLYNLFWRLKNILHISLYGFISFDYSFHDDHNCESYYYPSEGWIRTEGTNGVKEWNGSFYGFIYDFVTGSSVISHSEYHIGARGFAGLQIENSILGYAKEVFLRRPLE